MLLSPVVEQRAGRQLGHQHANRGTAPAILYAALRIAAKDPHARLVVLPSDHYVSDDSRFMSPVETAFHALTRSPELTILLGITAERPEIQYGWIEPGEPIPESPSLYRIGRFWEKPALSVAVAVWARGALWNSFVIVARAASLLGRIERAAPALFRAFTQTAHSLDTSREGDVMRRLYARIAPMDFSRGILAAERSQLAVLPVSGVQWSDVGDPDRLRALVLPRTPRDRPRALA